MKFRHILFLAAIAWAGMKLYNVYLAPMLELASSDDSERYDNDNITGYDGVLKKSATSPAHRYSKEDKAAEQNEQALLDAAAKGDKNKVEALIAGQVGVDSRDVLHRTPLMYAIWNGHDDVIVRLLAAGANPELKDRDGNNAFDYAAGRGIVQNVRLLLQRTHSQDDDHYIEYATVIAAALSGDASQMPAGTGKLASVNRITPEGQTPLHIAAGKGSLSLMATLIDRGGDVNIANASGQTPLYWAAWNNQAAALKFLISKGADIEAHDIDGETPLIVAARNDSREAVKALLESGADKYHADKEGQTAYIVAEDKGYKDLTTLLK